VDVVMGFAHQVMLPLVAEPPALEVLEEPGVVEELDEEPLPHAPAVSATATPTAAISADWRLPRRIGIIFIDA
jgi:hypothetical protein